MYTEPFAAGTSPIHRTDPRLRLLFAGLYSVPVAVAADTAAPLAAVGLSLLLVFLARLDALQVARRLAVVAGFLLLLWAVLPFTLEGEALFRVGPLAASGEGLALAALITFKSLAILMALTALLATMSVAAMGQALGDLGVPPKMVRLLLLTYRYIFVIEEEYQRLLRAAKIRGFRPRTDLHTYRTYAYMIGMLFVKAAFRAERVHQAMRCRGFCGRFHHLGEFPPNAETRVFCVLMTAAVIGIVILAWGGHGGGP